jgi:hypothetical protein
MPAKKQTRRRPRQKRQKTAKKSTHRHKKRTHRRLKGGNYARDVTNAMVDGTPVVKEGAVAIVPGYGTMTVEAYRRLIEGLDRNGNDLYR